MIGKAMSGRPHEPGSNEISAMSPALRQRILTAVVLIPLVLWTVWLASLPVYALVLGLFVALGGWEWARLSGITQTLVAIVYAAVVALALLAYWWLRDGDQGRLLTVVLSAALVWWLAACVWVLRPAMGAASQSSRQRWLKLLLGLVILVPAWVALLELRGWQSSDWQVEGRQWLVVLFGLVWVADIAAYFSGRAFGRHKLAPRVSPGKTWEGVAGAVLGGMIFMGGMGLWLPAVAAHLPVFLLLAFITVAVSVLGDLTESIAKRQAGMKDSSQLLPGHGGVMDRIDSLTSATPIFLLGLLWVHAHV